MHEPEHYWAGGGPLHHPWSPHTGGPGRRGRHDLLKGRGYVDHGERRWAGAGRRRRLPYSSSASLARELGYGQATPTEEGPADTVPDVDVAPSATGVHAMFCAADAPIIADLPAKPARQRRVFNMSNVRWSARLAAKPAMPAVAKAQRNLCRKLGLNNGDEVLSLEQVLQQLVSMFAGPLPDNIIAAMSTIFELEDEGQELLNEVLLQHAGEGIGDLEAGG